MSDLAEFFAMGGYAFYVWTSYAITTVILVGIVLWSHRQFKQSKIAAIRRAQQHRKRK